MAFERLDSRVMESVFPDRQTNLDVFTVDTDRIDRDRLGGWWACGDSGGQVEPGAVHPALDVAVLHVSFGQRHLTVGAFVTYGVNFTQTARNADPAPTDLTVYR